MPKIAHITDTPQLNETFGIVEADKGQLTLPVWMLSRGTSFELVVKGSVVDEGNSSREKDVHVLAKVDDSYIKEEFGNDVVVYINQGAPGDIYDKEVNFNKDNNTFRFNIGISIDTNSIDEGLFDKPRYVKIKYNVRTKYTKGGFLFGNKEEATAYDDVYHEQVFEFFIHKGIDNTRTWVGMDPGTTGSCVCLGVRGGSIANPNLKMLGNGIIPSCLILPQSTQRKDNITDYIPGEDYLYGQQARQMWKAESEKGSKCFVSIKKLLGYNKKKIPVLLQGEEQEFSGVEIAHLLIKGIDNDCQRHLAMMTEEERKKYYGHLTEEAQRLVVAVPNNYTLPKTIDMVESVRRLGRYSEIRCVYEPEAILFNYIMKEYASIQNQDNETIMVFDMGGATINASLYRLITTYQEDKTKIKVKTIGRVGYAVGGDNIDYALIETLLDVYVRSRSNGVIDEALRHEIEREYKNEFLQKIFPLKLALIAASKGVYNEMFVSEQMLVNYINDIFAGLKVYGYKPLDEEILKIELGIGMNGIWDDYRDAIVRNIVNSNYMKKFVYDRIEEATRDLMAFCDSGKIDKLIFSGRSVLFTGVKECVSKTLANRNIKIWNKLDDEEIKSAVARGACWYGMFGSTISLDNELITSSYGFKRIVDGKETFIPVIKSKNKYDEYMGRFSDSYDINCGFEEEGNIIEFYQVMGANTDDVFTNDKRYKLNLLGIEDTYTDTSSIEMTVDRNDRISYIVHFDNGDKCESGVMSSKNEDIMDDNDPAYVFATLQPKQKKHAVSPTNVRTSTLSPELHTTLPSQRQENPVPSERKNRGKHNRI